MIRPISYQACRRNGLLAKQSVRVSACLLGFLLTVTAASAAVQPEKVYIMNDYRYIPADATDDSDIGLTLCGTRCNALSTDYQNITDVGGWQLLKTASDRELTMELNSPFIKGTCVCVADEYLIKTDDRFSEERRRPRSEK